MKGRVACNADGQRKWSVHLYLVIAATGQVLVRADSG
jgi:hypothetical protein